MKKTIATSLPEEELAELDRVRERQSLSRSQALRQAVRWYVGAMRRLPAPEEPLPDEQSRQVSFSVTNDAGGFRIGGRWRAARAGAYAAARSVESP